MRESIGDIWIELMYSNPKFTITFLNLFLFVCFGDWGALILSLMFGYNWVNSNNNLLVVGLDDVNNG